MVTHLVTHRLWSFAWAGCVQQCALPPQTPHSCRPCFRWLQAAADEVAGQVPEAEREKLLQEIQGVEHVSCPTAALPALLPLPAHPRAEPRQPAQTPLAEHVLIRCPPRC